MGKDYKFKNISGEPQHFTGFPRIEIDEIIVTDDSGVQLFSHSPHFEEISDEAPARTRSKRNKMEVSEDSEGEQE
ncbi:MAG: hypothetical protein V3U02_04510 [Calditrichia bacterium]